jgi:GT2 family glycosyltransferase
MLDELMKVAESDESIGCVGPKIYYHSDRQRLWSAGGYIRFKESATKERGFRQIDRGQYDRTEEVPYINGCAMLVPRRVVEEIGLWDPLFHLAVDDGDWCMRMKRAGYRCFFAHKAILYHMVSPTLGGYKASRTFHNGRSLALFVRRYASPWQWLTFVVFTAVGLPLAFLRELPRGNQGAAVAKARGVFEGLRVPLAPPPRLG